MNYKLNVFSYFSMGKRTNLGFLHMDNADIVTDENVLKEIMEKKP